MSTDITGRVVRCDGPGARGGGCARTTRGAVALHTDRLQQQESAGWLFIKAGDAVWHYCPDCAPRHLSEYFSPEWP